MNASLVRIDEIIWNISSAIVEPLCPKHYLRLTAGSQGIMSKRLSCAEGPHDYLLSRSFGSERRYVRDRIDSKIFREMKTINLDDEAIPLAEKKVSSKDNKYFVTALLTESKIGLRLVVYAGEKGSDRKTQIFVEPAIKRLAFDQADLHPSDVFVEVEATFSDGTGASIKKKVK